MNVVRGAIHGKSGVCLCVFIQDNVLANKRGKFSYLNHDLFIWHSKRGKWNSSTPKITRSNAMLLIRFSLSLFFRLKKRFASSFRISFDMRITDEDYVTAFASCHFQRQKEKRFACDAKFKTFDVNFNYSKIHMPLYISEIYGHAQHLPISLLLLNGIFQTKELGIQVKFIYFRCLFEFRATRALAHPHKT